MFVPTRRHLSAEHRIDSASVIAERLVVRHDWLPSRLVSLVRRNHIGSSSLASLPATLTCTWVHRRNPGLTALHESLMPTVARELDPGVNRSRFSPRHLDDPPSCHFGDRADPSHWAAVLRFVPSGFNSRNCRYRQIPARVGLVGIRRPAKGVSTRHAGNRLLRRIVPREIGRNSTLIAETATAQLDSFCET